MECLTKGSVSDKYSAELWAVCSLVLVLEPEPVQPKCMQIRARPKASIFISTPNQTNQNLAILDQLQHSDALRQTKKKNVYVALSDVAPAHSSLIFVDNSLVHHCEL